MELTDKNFIQEVEQNNGLVLVDFFAPWCGPCKAMEPIIKKLMDEYGNTPGIKIAQMNVDESQEIAQKYNVMSIPTIILFKEGKLIEQMVGLQTKENLKQIIEKYK